jgi:hypothetical protein
MKEQWDKRVLNLDFRSLNSPLCPAAVMQNELHDKEQIEDQVTSIEIINLKSNPDCQKLQ